MALVRENTVFTDFVATQFPADLAFDLSGGSMSILLTALNDTVDRYDTNFPKLGGVSGKKRSDHDYDGRTALLHYWRGLDGAQQTLELDLVSSERIAYSIMSFSGEAYLGRVQRLNDGGGIGTFTLEDVPANAKVYLYMHTRQFAISETSGATEIGQEQYGTTTENIHALYEKTNGSSPADVSFTTTRPGGRDTTIILFEVIPLVGGVQIAAMWDKVSVSGADPYTLPFYGKGSHMAVFGTLSNTTDPPISSVSFGAQSLTELFTPEDNNRYATLWELFLPAAGWETVSVDAAGTPSTAAYGALSWKGTRGIVQSKSFANMAGDPFTMQFDNNTEVGSKCYVAIGRNGSSGGGVFTDSTRHLFNVGSSDHLSVGEQDGDGTQVSFTFDPIFGRDQAAVIWEMGVGGAGNRMILMMSELGSAYDRIFRPRSLPKLLTLPQPQILTPSAAQVKALAA